MEERQEFRVLITVKTYPIPSEAYRELVCTAGVREDGTFIRLYPLDYRYMPYWQWYKKYQWVRVNVERNVKDPRPESYRPVQGSDVVPLGDRLSTKNNWAERKRFVLAQGVQTMCGLQKMAPSQCSLGIVKPRDVAGSGHESRP